LLSALSVIACLPSVGSGEDVVPSYCSAEDKTRIVVGDVCLHIEKRHRFRVSTSLPSTPTPLGSTDSGSEPNNADANYIQALDGAATEAGAHVRIAETDAGKQLEIQADAPAFEGSSQEVATQLQRTL